MTFNSCTCNLSKFVDSAYVRKCKSDVRDTKDFIRKLSSVKNILENSFLLLWTFHLFISTSISKLKRLFKQLEEKQKNSIPSIFIKKLIFMYLKSNVFWFNNEYYRQTTGTTIGSPMALNYAIFMDNFEQNLLHDWI